MVTTLSVKLGPRSYPIGIGRGLLAQAGSFARDVLGDSARRAIVISNERVLAKYGRVLLRALRSSGFDTDSLTVGDGERFKTLRTATLLYDELIKRRVERSDVIFALGGGVVGDLAGFVAATYLRGMRFVQVPTTLLAQIDSSVGGKTGVNHALGKNMIGAFHQPSLVVVDIATLESLPGRELRAGLYEAVKYAVLADRNLFDRIGEKLGKIKDLDSAELSHLIRRCCSIKAEVVRLDERESGLRRILNLGHTIGHAIEAATGYRRFLHGEAVGLGLLVESLIAERLKLLDHRDGEAIRSLVLGVGRLPGASTIAFSDIIAAMARDKKRQAGNAVFVLPVKVGQVVVRSDVPLPVVRSALRDALQERQF